MHAETPSNVSPVLSSAGPHGTPDSAIANGVIRTDALAPPVIVPASVSASAPAAAQPQEPSAPGTPWKSTLITAAVALAAGGAGAWGYEYFLVSRNHSEGPPAHVQSASAAPQAPAPQTPAAPAPVTRTGDPELKSDLKKIHERVDRVEERIALQAAKPDLSADLAALKRRVADVLHDTNRVDSIEDRINEMREQITGLESELRGVHEEISEREAHEGHARGARSTSATPERDGDRVPASGDERSIEVSLKRAKTLLSEKKFDGAYDVFCGLEAAHPDDARVWYFAALTRGLKSGEWTGETARLAEKGVECERSGHPTADQIDAAVDGLTRETGKDWLDGYRRRARPQVPEPGGTANAR